MKKITYFPDRTSERIVKRGVLLLAFIFLCVLYACQKDLSEAEVVITETIPAVSDTTFFSYENYEDALKNRIIAALKQRDVQQGGIVRQNAAPYGQPMWDECLSTTIDSITRFLVPMADIGGKKILALWGFDCRVGSDTVYNGIAIAPPSLEDTSYYAWDVNMLYDYFRYRLGYPTERKVKFAEDTLGAKQEQVDIRQNAVYSYRSCSQICWSFEFGHIGWDWDNAPLSLSQNSAGSDNCFLSCKIFYFVTFDVSDYFLIDAGSGYGGGGGGGGSGTTPPQPTTYTVTVTAGPGGTATGGGTYNEGSTCNIVATASTGYVFVKWDGPDILSSQPTTSFTVTKNMSATAYFKSSTTDPCAHLNKIKTNDTIAEKIALLKGEAMNNSRDYETARYQLRGADGQVKDGFRRGYPGTDYVDMIRESGQSYDWMFHSHQKDNGLLPSGGDLYMLYKGYSSGLITDWTSFKFGMINHLGIGYMLTISDHGLFKQWALEKELNNPNSRKIINDLDYKMEGDLTADEATFLEYLQNSGLSVMKINDAALSGTNWKRIEYDTSTGTVKTKPCN